MDTPVITLLTDFGHRDPYAGIMKGVILGRCPDARIVDLTHAIPPQDVRAGALLLRSAVPFFPDGTIHVAVVDPGVGSARAPLLVRTARAWFIGPDNGLLHPAAERAGIEGMIELNERRYHLEATGRTFHGRDIFAPVAGHLAAGVDPASLGTPQGALASLSLPLPRREGDQIRGEVIYADGFGNLITNVTAQELANFPHTPLSVSIGGCNTSIPVAQAYADVASGDAVALVSSWGHLEVAIRDGNAAAGLGIAVGTALTIQPA